MATPFRQVLLGGYKCPKVHERSRKIGGVMGGAVGEERRGVSLDGITRNSTKSAPRAGPKLENWTKRHHLLPFFRRSMLSLAHCSPS